MTPSRENMVPPLICRRSARWRIRDIIRSRCGGVEIIAVGDIVIVYVDSNLTYREPLLSVAGKTAAIIIVQICVDDESHLNITLILEGRGD